MSDLRFRFTIILLTILASCYLLWPTYKFYSTSKEDFSSYSKEEQKELKNNAIALGLDLQGGMYVVLEVDVSTLLKNLATKSSKDFIQLEQAIDSAATLASENQQIFLKNLKIL